MTIYPSSDTLATTIAAHLFIQMQCHECDVCTAWAVHSKHDALILGVYLSPKSLSWAEQLLLQSLPDLGMRCNIICSDPECVPTSVQVHIQALAKTITCFIEPSSSHIHWYKQVLERGEFTLVLGMQRDAKTITMPQATTIRVALDELPCLQVGIQYLEQHDDQHNHEVVLRYMKTGFFKLS